MKELITILDPYEIGDKLNSLHPAIDLLEIVIKRNPDIASINISKRRHFTILDCINSMQKDMKDIELFQILLNF